MANYEYHNKMKTIVDDVRAMHVHLIERVCSELGAPDKIPEMVEKYVGDSIRIKKFKDKNHPKRPKSGYMIFCDQNRADVRKTLKDASFTETIKAVAQKWNALSDEEKNKYLALAEEDRTRYTRELETYNSEIYKSNTV